MAVTSRRVSVSFSALPQPQMITGTSTALITPAATLAASDAERFMPLGSVLTMETQSASAPNSFTHFLAQAT